MIGITERGDAAFHDWTVLPNRVSGLILITKNLPTLMPRIGLAVTNKTIVHATVTGWGGSNLEPYVPPPDVVMDEFACVQYPNDRLVLRIDPIIPTEEGLERALAVLKLRRRDSRVRISFLDAYPHVRTRLRKAGLSHLIDWNGLHAPLERRKECLEYIKGIVPGVEVCSEPGIPCTGCVSALDLKALHLPVPDNIGRKGQRGACMCIAQKRELLTARKQCPHQCVYCYWR